VETIGGARQPGPPTVAAQAVEVDAVQAQRPNHFIDGAFVFAVVDVDPQQAIAAERSDDVVGELDRAILSAGVEQPD
jgi:hypothetical protein